MMEKVLTDKEQEVLNKFGQFEMTARQTYVHLANRMTSLSCFGFAKFFLNEAEGEKGHYEKLEEFANALGGELSVESVPKIESNAKNIGDALDFALSIEKELLAEYEKEFENKELSAKVRIFLQEFVNIQVDEVGEYLDLKARMALTSDMLLFDHDMMEKLVG